MCVFPYSTSSNFLCREGVEKLIFWTQFNSYFWQKWHHVDHKVLVDALRSSSNNHHISKEGREKLKQQYMFSPCSKSSCFPCREGTWNMIFCMKVYNCFWQKWHAMDHKVLVYVVQSSSHYDYTLMECYRILKQQRRSLLAAHNSISCAETVSNIWRFSLSFSVVFQ